MSGAETVYVQAKTAQLRSGKTSLDTVVGNVKARGGAEVVGKMTAAGWRSVGLRCQRLDFRQQNIEHETVRYQR